MRKVGANYVRFLYGNMAIATDKDGHCVGLANNQRRAAQNRPAFENDGDRDT